MGDATYRVVPKTDADGLPDSLSVVWVDDMDRIRVIR